MSSSKKNVRFWALKIFIITLIISSGVSVVAEVFMNRLGLIPAILVVLLLIGIGVFFDIVGVAFASCDQTPFVAMSSKKIKSAVRALKLLKNAGVVSNICNDVIGDVCGIVSGAAGAAIVVKIVSDPSNSLTVSIVISSLIAACTVAGKAMGKNYAMRNSTKLVQKIGVMLSVFDKKK